MPSYALRGDLAVVMGGRGGGGGPLHWRRTYLVSVFTVQCDSAMKWVMGKVATAKLYKSLLSLIFSVTKFVGVLLFSAAWAIT